MPGGLATDWEVWVRWKLPAMLTEIVMDDKYVSSLWKTISK